MIDWKNLDIAGVIAARAAIDVELQAPRPELSLTVGLVMKALNEVQETPADSTDEACLFRAGVLYVVGVLVTAARQAADDQEFKKAFNLRLTEYAKQGHTVQ